MRQVLLVNFGGPRSLDEVEPFLTELLTDRDLIETKLPNFLHNFLFRRIARKRASSVRHDYALIGGKSPIYFDTEETARLLQEKIGLPVRTLHRYLSSTHNFSGLDEETLVLPLFPQYCKATTGSMERLLSPYPLKWIKSYATHPAFINAHIRRIQELNLTEEETILLFSAHGVPQALSDRGDPYEKECKAGFELISKAFPKALSRLAFQSQFGKGLWLKPSTQYLSETILDWHQGRKTVVFIPLSFTSDHIETLYEIEYLYLPLIRQAGLTAVRCPALNLEPYWIDALCSILKCKAALHLT